MITKQESPRTAASRRVWAGGALALALALPAFELAAHAVVQSGVPRWQEWRAASQLVRRQWQAGDLVVAAPAWTDPLMRWWLGDLLTLADVGRNDLTGYRRLWVLGLGDAKGGDAAALGVPRAAPAWQQRVGRLRVARWTLPAAGRVRYADLSTLLREADVSLGDRACTWQADPSPYWGGLGSDAAPLQSPLGGRFVCDPARPWLWVGATVIADLHLQPRFCLWTHPAEAAPIRVLFRHQPLGDRLVLHHGLDFFQDRGGAGAPVQLQVWLDGQRIATWQHRDGEGWRRESVALPVDGGQPTRRGDLRFDIRSSQPHLRWYCWNASTWGPRAVH